MSDLQKLIEVVERGEEVKWADFILHIGIQNAKLAGSAHYGSLDAAKALHEALLPEWGWDVGMGNYNPIEAFVHFGVVGENYKCIGVMSDNPARAWLLAILRAHAAQQVTS